MSGWRALPHRCSKRSMLLVVDFQHWLDQDGNLPHDDLRFRRRVMRVARFVEYGGTLPPRSVRETLVECKRRPAHKSCPGLMWVRKEPDKSIVAFCPACDEAEMVISNWEGTAWANGMMEPLLDDELPALH